MADTFNEVSSESWSGRIGGSFKGIVFGLLLLVAAVIVLWWNEGRAVSRSKALQEGSQIAVSIAAEPVDAGNEGKLVEVTGSAVTADTLADVEFGVTAKALKLERVAEMYQWTEYRKNETKNNVGGGSTTTTTYTYQKSWENHLVNSSQFKHPEDHANPPAMAYGPRELVAGKITVGAFTLSPSLVAKIGGAVALPIANSDALPAPLQARSALVDGTVYLGADAAAPQIGDQRISFRETGVTPVSLVARQVGNTFEPYRTKSGATIELLQVGTFGTDEMFAHAKDVNSKLTWGLRVLGWFLMFLGFGLIFQPLVALTDVLPLLGSLAGMGTGLLAFLLATSGTLLVIALAWIFFRPLLGFLLLAVTIAIVTVLILKRKKPRPAH